MAYIGDVILMTPHTMTSYAVFRCRNFDDVTIVFKFGHYIIIQR